MNHLKMLLTGAAFATALSAGATNAGVVLFENFDSENGGATALNYNGFTQFHAWKNVDLVRTPDYGITGSGSVVDLDGTSGPGRLDSSSAYYFAAGDWVTLTFDASGNQRDNQVDDLTFALDFSGAVSTNHLFINGYDFGPASTVNYSFQWQELLNGTTGYAQRSISFLANNSSSVGIRFETQSHDNVGPIIDNVKLSIGSAVPEPATWAMMIAGFGLVGASLRRGRSSLATA